MATATKPRARSAKVTVTPEQITRIAEDVGTHDVIERRRELRTFVLGLLSGVNVHLLGPAGTGKSLALRAFCSRIERARYFEKTLHPQQPADALIGGYDMPRFAKTGEFARQLEGRLGAVDIALLDEITRANGPVTDMLLPLMNTEERLVEKNGGMGQAPLRALFTGSNFMPDADDARLGAFVDRFTLMREVNYVTADASFQEMFRRHHERRISAIDDALPIDAARRRMIDSARQSRERDRATITIEQFTLAQALVQLIEPTQEFLDAYAELRRKARSEGLPVSDRRWMELGRVARAHAWLAGRDHLVREDVVATEDGLWRQRDEIPTATGIILPFRGRFEQEASRRRDEAEQHISDWQEIRPRLEAQTPGEEDDDVMTRVTSTGRALALCWRRTQASIEEAEREQRDATSLRDLVAELEQIRGWYGSNDLPDNWDRTVT